MRGVENRVASGDRGGVENRVVGFSTTTEPGDRRGMDKYHTSGERGLFFLEEDSSLTNIPPQLPQRFHPAG
ncbi:unnamed protein product [Linum trigynum]|uniref:Uncharacterized protein n=1 Tax=Linum trigynum TaxID=586398 RepID=A0AAV2DQM0_9ROSI